MTRAVHDWADTEPSRRTWLTGCVGRHVAGDWGDLDGDDRAANDAGARHGYGLVRSVYRLPAELAGESIGEDRVWVITHDVEDPDTATTILWPGDYVRHHLALKQGP